MRVLDRNFFHKDIQLSAARVYDAANLSRVRNEVNRSKDIFPMRTCPVVRPDPTDITHKRKCLLLRPDVKHDDSSSWSETVARLVKLGDISLFPYDLRLCYEHWSALEILQAILPEELHEEIPTGFHQVGHIAHFNLRDRYTPYKSIIGEVTKDKNSTIKTVVNKLETLDIENEFRVLESELIAGEPRYQVEVREQNCTFHFDFSKVFWNSKQGTEHERLIAKFKPAEAICDVMAGVGPFAIPAAKKGCFVWANDLNPHCFKGLTDSMRLNKIGGFAKAFQEDGHTFIGSATQDLLKSDHEIKVPARVSRTEAARQGIALAKSHTTIVQPKTFSHYIMNLPATAMEFLPAFVGLFAGHESMFAPATHIELPTIHCYCFENKADESDDDFVGARKNILRRLSAKLGIVMDIKRHMVEIHDVRNVAPKKHDFCISFQIPPEVAFARGS